MYNSYETYMLANRLRRAGMRMVWCNGEGFHANIRLTQSMFIQAELLVSNEGGDGVVWNLRNPKHGCVEPGNAVATETLLAAAPADVGVDLMGYLSPLVHQLTENDVPAYGEMNRFMAVFAKEYSFRTFAGARDHALFYQFSFVEDDVDALPLQLRFMEGKDHSFTGNPFNQKHVALDDVELLDHYMLRAGHSAILVPFSLDLNEVMDHAVLTWEKVKSGVVKTDEGYQTFDKLKTQVRRNRLTRLGV